MPQSLLDLAHAQLLAWLHDNGQPPMRARQLRRWLLAGRAESFEDMTDLPRDLRLSLARDFVPLGMSVARHLEADDGTHKLLLRLALFNFGPESDREASERRRSFSPLILSI